MVFGLSFIVGIYILAYSDGNGASFLIMFYWGLFAAVFLSTIFQNWRLWSIISFIEKFKTEPDKRLFKSKFKLKVHITLSLLFLVLWIYPTLITVFDYVSLYPWLFVLVAILGIAWGYSIFSCYKWVIRKIDVLIKEPIDVINSDLGVLVNETYLWEKRFQDKLNYLYWQYKHGYNNNGS